MRIKSTLSVWTLNFILSRAFEIIRGLAYYFGGLSLTNSNGYPFAFKTP